MRERSLVLAFEGMDAAGKGSTIRRVTRALDARYYRVVPVGAPTDEERAQPYLWRFWRHMPADGKAVIFDRSWYGRVLVERVEGYCAEADWMRAYHEINEFEQELVAGGAIVAKFWLSVTLAEQLKRFRAREQTPYKQHKITAEDWRNREKWPAYEQAVCDMVERTSTELRAVVPGARERQALCADRGAEAHRRRDREAHRVGPHSCGQCPDESGTRVRINADPRDCPHECGPTRAAISGSGNSAACSRTGRRAVPGTSSR